jgi:two-component system nitrogen regulation sensor histidine kinase NtrY
MVVYSSFKVSEYFYRQNESFGFQSYFAILPVIDGTKKLGTIVVELKSKPLLAAGSFPDLLVDKEVKGNSDEFKNYSFAFYTDNVLIGQSGTYVYNIRNNEFKGELKSTPPKALKVPSLALPKNLPPTTIYYTGLPTAI